jgi:hypothetical protein
MKNKGNQGRSKPFSLARLIVTVIIAIAVVVLLKHLTGHR